MFIVEFFKMGKIGTSLKAPPPRPPRVGRGGGRKWRGGGAVATGTNAQGNVAQPFKSRVYKQRGVIRGNTPDCWGAQQDVSVQ